MKKTEKSFRVTVCVDATKRIGHDAFEGIIGFIRKADCRWTLHSSAGNRLWQSAEIKHIPTDELDGVISYDSNAETISRMVKHKVRWVSIFNEPVDASVPAVLSDNEAIGRLAGQHLLDLHLKQFAYYGSDIANNSQVRFSGFANFLKENGMPEPAYIKIGTDDIMKSLSGSRRTYLKQLGRELLALTDNGRKALGVFAYSDNMGITLIDACQEVGLPVPERVAVIAVGTDNIICELATPPLTTIQQNAEMIGGEAARMLDDLLRGKKLKERRILVSPLGIKIRLSTDIYAVDDSYINKAVRIIRRDYSRGLKVQDILDELGISRRLFEKRFRLALGRTPYEEITRMRIRYAETLLAQTSDSMLSIALAAGFADEKRFRTNFRKITGMTPGAYRRKTKGSHHML